MILTMRMAIVFLFVVFAGVVKSQEPSGTPTPSPRPTAEVGSLPVTKLPVPRTVQAKDLTELPCTHYASTKGRSGNPGTKAKPWDYQALFNLSKAKALKTWRLKNPGRIPVVCDFDDQIRPSTIPRVGRRDIFVRGGDLTLYPRG